MTAKVAEFKLMLDLHGTNTALSWLYAGTYHGEIDEEDFKACIKLVMG